MGCGTVKRVDQEGIKSGMFFFKESLISQEKLKLTV